MVNFQTEGEVNYLIVSSESVAMYVTRYMNTSKDKPFYTVTVIDEDGTPFRLFCTGEAYEEFGKLTQGQTIQPRLRLYSGQNGRTGVQCEGFFSVT